MVFSDLVEVELKFGNSRWDKCSRETIHASKSHEAVHTTPNPSSLGFAACYQRDARTQEGKKDALHECARHQNDTPMKSPAYGNGVKGYTIFTIRMLAARMMKFISRPMRMKSLKR